MNMSCEIIRDLLPLYHDGVCSDESKALVEEHLVVCGNCKADLEAMNDKLPIETAEQNLKEAEAVQKLAEKWKKGMWKSILKGAITTILIIAVAVLLINLFVGFKIVVN